MGPKFRSIALQPPFFFPWAQGKAFPRGEAPYPLCDLPPWATGGLEKCARPGPYAGVNEDALRERLRLPTRGKLGAAKGLFRTLARKSTPLGGAPEGARSLARSRAMRPRESAQAVLQCADDDVQISSTPVHLPAQEDHRESPRTRRAQQLEPGNGMAGPERRESKARKKFELMLCVDHINLEIANMQERIQGLENGSGAGGGDDGHIAASGLDLMSSMDQLRDEVGTMQNRIAELECERPLSRSVSLAWLEDGQDSSNAWNQPRASLQAVVTKSLTRKAAPAARARFELPNNIDKESEILMASISKRINADVAIVVRSSRTKKSKKRMLKRETTAAHGLLWPAGKDDPPSRPDGPDKSTWAEDLGDDDMPADFEEAPRDGLTGAQADKLLKKWGKNELVEKVTPKWLIFLRLLIGPMPIMLWIASLIEVRSCVVL